MPSLWVRVILACSLSLFVVSPSDAQINPGPGYPPGQYPPGRYPPGQYPPGQAPGGGVPAPWGKKGSKKQPDVTKPDFFADGQTVSNDGKQLVVATDDGRTLTLGVSPRTVWQNEGKPAVASDIKPGMVVHIEAAEDEEANLTGLTVNITAEKKLAIRPPVSADAQDPAAKGPERETTEPPDPNSLGAPPDDPDRPVLRRGKPRHTAASSDADDVTPVSTAKAEKSPQPTPKKADPNEETEFTIEEHTNTHKLSSGVPTLVAQTMDWVTTFANGLPNFLCQQITTRYSEASKDDGWQPLDVITAKVVYENGAEDYRDITIGGKRTNKSMMELGGATSTGEFAATLRDLFSPGTMAQFQLARSGELGTTKVAIYNFTVDLPHSHWTIKVGGQSLRPAFSGQVWINKTTSEVRKIEMQADNIPANFPLRSVFTSVAYDPVQLGTASFLLPVVAVNQSCVRKSTVCTKNDVEWRDYHKFSGESTITYK